MPTPSSGTAESLKTGERHTECACYESNIPERNDSRNAALILGHC